MDTLRPIRTHLVPRWSTQAERNDKVALLNRIFEVVVDGVFATVQVQDESLVENLQLSHCADVAYGEVKHIILQRLVLVDDFLPMVLLLKVNIDGAFGGGSHFH